MKNGREWKLLLYLFLVCLFAFGCVYGLQQRVSRQRVFGVSYMTMNNDFYEAINGEIQKTVQSQKDRLIVRDPQLDLELQKEQIESFIELGVDGIFINPIDSQALGPLLLKAQTSGIPVVVVDAPVDGLEETAVCTITSNNYQAGVLCAQDMMSRKDSASILLLEHSQVFSAQERIRGFLDTIEGHPEYTIAARAECLGQLEVAMPVTQELIAAHPEADVVMALNDPSAMGALAALQSMNRPDVMIYGVDGSVDVKQQLLAGSQIQATAVQSPLTLGARAAGAMYDWLEGKPVEKAVLLDVYLLSSETIEPSMVRGWQ